MSTNTIPFIQEASYAILSDIHGDLKALDAVLKEIERFEVQGIYVAGDLFFGGNQPLEVWHTLQRAKAECIRGASDTALTRYSPDVLPISHAEDKSRIQTFAKTQGALGDLILERLRRLPDRLRVPLPHGGEMLMVHGSPVDPLEEITHDLSNEEMLRLLDDDPADVVICGGSHVPFQRRIDDYLIINAGSVGQAPEGNVAHFSILTSTPSGVRVQQHYADLES